MRHWSKCKAPHDPIPKMKDAPPPGEKPGPAWQCHGQCLARKPGRSTAAGGAWRHREGRAKGIGQSKGLQGVKQWRFKCTRELH